VNNTGSCEHLDVARVFDNRRARFGHSFGSCSSEVANVADSQSLDAVLKDF
jgi:hypothetical protein